MQVKEFCIKKGVCIVVAEYLPFKNMALLDNYKKSTLFAHPYIYIYMMGKVV